MSLEFLTRQTDSDISGDDVYSPVGPYIPDSPDFFSRKGATANTTRPTNRPRGSFESSSKSIQTVNEMDESNFLHPDNSNPADMNPVPDPNRSSVGNESATSSVKTSETLKKDDSRRKSTNSTENSRGSFGSLSNFSLKREGLFSRGDKSPTRPNLSTITEGSRSEISSHFLIDMRRSQSSVSTPKGPQADKLPFTHDVITPPRTHRMTSSDASSIDLNSEEFGSQLSPMTPNPALCIQHLGPIGAELLTGNQKQSIVDMCSRLQEGILVLKHGRTGKPKLRALYCDEALSTLYWREVGKIVDDKGKTVLNSNGWMRFLIF